MATTNTLWRAVAESKPETVRQLIEAGEFIDYTTSMTTEMHPALRLNSGSEKMVRLLLENRACVSAATIDGETPLHAAVADQVRDDFPTRTVQLLLEHGASLSAKTIAGETPLHTAAANAWGHEAEARLMLQKGASVSARNQRGETPLHLAAFAANQEVVEQLLQRGASVQATTNTGKP
ncbi:ankyrin repeat-containing domain protein [Baffinella frigidus]|nr:ankyrin repeat-containing domain protein [Cryptophyta sp. CCMP2293]